MNPIYKFELSGNGHIQQAYPVYGADLTKEFDKEAGQQFFRAKLSGKLTFKGDDYFFIVNNPIDTQYTLEVFISYDMGATWGTYWKGQFWKTDCAIDEDSKTAVVEPAVIDAYTAVMAGLDKEYNLIDLKPEIVAIKADKRPMIQIYVPGETTVGCFLGGMWWEQECEAVTSASDLTNTYHFRLRDNYRIIGVTGNTQPPLPGAFIGSVPTSTNYEITQGEFRFSYSRSSYGSSQYEEIFSIYWGQTLMWRADLIVNNPTTVPATVYLTPVGSASGNVQLDIQDVAVYGRMVTDVGSEYGVNFPRIPDNDIVANNRNYHYVIPFSQYEIAFSGVLSDMPTEWGLARPGKYYQVPDFNHEYFPVGRSAWRGISLWFQNITIVSEPNYRKEISLKDSYPIFSVISVLLAQIAPGITHQGSTAYSQFLYGENLIGITQMIAITPKSNVISAGYDKPAQKAPITLRGVLDMLRDCFRCYWFIDNQNQFRIEHIQYFRNGGSYAGGPVIGVDLLAQTVTRNGKAWAYARNRYEYDKPEMAARYQFGWMDECTQIFEGYPIDISAKYVEPGRIEQITVNNYTSDIDYIMLNPGAISKDGFFLLSAVHQSGGEQVNYNLDSYELRNYNIVQATGKYGTTATYKHIVIPVTPGRTIRVVASSNSGTDARIAWLTSNAEPVAGGDVPFVPGTTLIIQSRATTEDYVVPNGATYMFVYISSSPYNYKPQSVTMLAQEEYSYLPYYDFETAIAHHNTQNGYVAFTFLQKYYAFDMPARTYTINGELFSAIGIKKFKKQVLTFPALYDLDLNQLIRTFLGNGTIGKLSINLSSRNAEATLYYDTE